LFKGIILTVYYENHMKPVNTSGNVAELVNVKACVTSRAFFSGKKGTRTHVWRSLRRGGGFSCNENYLNMSQNTLRLWTTKDIIEMSILRFSVRADGSILFNYWKKVPERRSFAFLQKRAVDTRCYLALKG
jgi:hypothetical protein